MLRRGLIFRNHTIWHDTIGHKNNHAVNCTRSGLRCRCYHNTWASLHYIPVAFWRTFCDNLRVRERVTQQGNDTILLIQGIHAGVVPRFETKLQMPWWGSVHVRETNHRWVFFVSRGFITHKHTLSSTLYEEKVKVWEGQQYGASLWYSTRAKTVR